MIRFFVSKKKFQTTKYYIQSTYRNDTFGSTYRAWKYNFLKKDFLSKHFYLKSNPPKRWKWKMNNTHVWIFKNDRVLDDGASVDVWIYPNTFHKQISFTWPDLISSVMVYSCADFTGWIQVVMCKLCSTYKNDILASAAVTQNKSGSSGVWYPQWFLMQ